MSLRSVPPERMLRALLLQVMFTIRSERQLMEQLDYNLMYRWFVGLGMDDDVWSPTVFIKNRERLFNGDIAEHFFDEVLGLAQELNLVSSEHFTVDGSLIQAWAGQKSFQLKAMPKHDSDETPKTGGGGNAKIGRNVASNFREQKRDNDTHQSTTDPDARLFKKGGEGAKLCFMGHLLTENRNGYVVNLRVTQATGKAEREAALEMISEALGVNRITLGADKGDDDSNFIQCYSRVSNHNCGKTLSLRCRRRHPQLVLSESTFFIADAPSRSSFRVGIVSCPFLALTNLGVS